MTAGRGKAQAIDWQALRDKLAALGAERSAARQTELLAERARRLAQPPRAQTLDEQADMAVELKIGSERYAIEVQHVVAISRLDALVPLPRAQPPLIGLTLLRGVIIPTLDLRSLLGITDAPPARPWLVALGGEEPEVALRADEVLDVGPLPAIAPDAALETRPSCLRGASVDGVGLLDVELLLSVEFAQGRQPDRRAPT